MTNPKYVTIDTSDIPAADKKWWLRQAERLADFGNFGNFADSATIVRAFANALPDPWPTAPGSTARTDRWRGMVGEVRIAVVDQNGDWSIAGYGRTWSVGDLIEQGFVPLHDAGADQ